jgi:hypothetical protein
MTRRDLLKTLPPAVVGTALHATADSSEAQVKWSSGTASPRLKAPSNAADAHPTEQGTKPDDAVVFDLLSDWAPEANTRHRILVENAAVLYGWK